MESDFYEYISQADRIVDSIKNPDIPSFNISEVEKFRNTRLMYAENSGDVAQYPQAKTAIDYARRAGFDIVGDDRDSLQQVPSPDGVTASRPDMPYEVWRLQQIRNGKWVWNRK